MKKVLFLLVFVALCMTSCEEESSKGSGASSIVVEGWIEDGGFPVVIVTRSMAVSSEYHGSDELSDYLVRWARVVVSDGIDTVTLTGKYDPGYYPSYIYTTSRMKGQGGRQYSLLVECGDQCATATTTIPSGRVDCDFRVERCPGSDTLYQVVATFVDNPLEKNYYQFFSRVGTASKQYLASYLGSVDDEVLGEKTVMTVFRGHRLTAEDYTPYFLADDTVSVKFAQVDEASYLFWDSYTKTLSLSGNMFLSSDAPLMTNVKGGMGYWCGYLAVTDHIVIADSVSQTSRTSACR